MAQTVTEVDQRDAQAVEGIHKKLESFDVKLGVIENDLRWINRIGAFVGMAIVAGVTSLFWLSNRAGHVEEAITTLQSEFKNQGEAVRAVQSEFKNQNAQFAKLVAALEAIEKRMAPDTSRRTPPG
jgi:hypothetical protein